jgi:glycosidase
MKPSGEVNNGIDGWRLDVASCIKHPFWKKFRKFVKEINSESIIIGEIFGDIDFLKPYLEGDEFDSVMNYNFTFICVEFFIEKNITSDEFHKKLINLMNNFKKESVYSMQNLLCSHDTNRISTHILNRGKFSYKNWGEYGNFSKGTNKKFNTNSIDELSFKIQKLLILFQMTSVGAPMIYYGDEVGMQGANDPCSRKPMIWEDIKYDDEKINGFGKKYDNPIKIEVNNELFSYYKLLIDIRNKHESLRLGDYDSFIIKENLYGFKREYNGEIIYIVINNSEMEKEIKSPNKNLINLLNNEEIGNSIKISPISGMILR